MDEKRKEEGEEGEMRGTKEREKIEIVTTSQEESPSFSSSTFQRAGALLHV